MRSALDATAALWCEQSTPCLTCRMMVRDLILTFLAEVPEPLKPIPPLELRMKLSREGADA